MLRTSIIWLLIGSGLGALAACCVGVENDASRIDKGDHVLHENESLPYQDVVMTIETGMMKISMEGASPGSRIEVVYELVEKTPQA